MTHINFFCNNQYAITQRKFTSDCFVEAGNLEYRTQVVSSNHKSHFYILIYVLTYEHLPDVTVRQMKLLISSAREQVARFSLSSNIERIKTKPKGTRLLSFTATRDQFHLELGETHLAVREIRVIPETKTRKNPLALSTRGETCVDQEPR